MTALATDSFTRANAGTLGASWTEQAGSGGYKIVSNAATPVSLTGADAWTFNNTVAWPNNQYSQANITVTGTSGSQAGEGVAVRAASGAVTGYRIVIDHAASGNFDLEKQNAGSLTTIANTTQAFTDGDLLYLEVQGTSLVVKINGATIAALSSTDASIASGNAGITFSTSETAASLDNWEGGNFINALPPGLGPSLSMVTELQQTIGW